MLLQPYMNFDGRCEEAVEFYRQAIGAEVVMLMRYSDSPEPCDPQIIPPGNENKVMHTTLKIGDSVLMASDCNCSGKPSYQGITLALTANSVDEAERLFVALSDGGQIHMPLEKTFFSEKFGMLADRFGVSWMVLVEQKPS
ncbi:MAG: VOC family protein [Planctomycetota bacterium]|nr:VOC family protein [Planctomycetota bacterium]MDA1211050.1 VOC family protein [Planctomycetota bacterium]